MEIIYRADDGREFDNEYECEAYENQQKIAALNLKSRFFNCEGQLLDITNLDDCIENGWYMEIATMEEARFLAEYAEENVRMTLFETTPQVGRFYFDGNDEQWHPIEDLYTPYARALKVFEEED